MKQHPSHDAVAARAVGKSAVRARTVWHLNLADTLELRCLTAPEGEHPFVVEAKRDGRWNLLAAGRDPLRLLRIVTDSNTAVAALARFQVPEPVL